MGLQLIFIRVCPSHTGIIDSLLSMLWEGRCPTGAPFGLVSSSAQCSSQTAPFSRPFRVTHTRHILTSRRNNISYKFLIIPSVVNLLLAAYLAVLITNKYIYYFDAPFRHYSSDLISASSYIPFLLLFIFIPLVLFTIRIIKLSDAKRWIKVVLLFNMLIYVVLIISFSYWGLYSIWN